ncbi:MAG: tRNA (guanosine(46)-N7)-methyltransferase TrmB, partial [Spirochaetales bacterium]
HKKRRLLTAEFASLLLASLVPGGYIWIATDWVDYAGQIAEIFLSFPVTSVPLENLDRDTFERFPGKYEEKAGSAGREVHEFFYRKNR